MRIGELSKRTGVSIRMLRYYEAEGLLSPHRTEAGYRDYGPVDEETVLQIRTLGTAGMTLSMIRDFLPCALEARGEYEPCDELLTRLQQQIADVDTRIEKLTQSRATLSNIFAKLSSARPSP